MMKTDEFSLYVHIPFCNRKCLYCDFCSFPNCTYEKRSKYIEVLIDEIIEKSKFFTNKIIKTLYFGGGTPTFLSINELSLIVNAIKENFKIKSDAEITIECNPMIINSKTNSNSDLDNYFSSLLSLGFNRLSIGIQSTNDNELKTIGRGHTYIDAKNTYYSARKMEFQNISVDLMFGLPSQSKETLIQSLNDILSLKSEHISIYSLQLEEGSALYKLRNKFSFPDEDEVAEMYEIICKTLKNNGYKHYEISNFAKECFESKHNSSYWDLSEYLGVGLSSHSYYGNKRYENTKDFEKYINRNFLENSTAISKKESIEEYIMLSLRTQKGIDFNEFFEIFGEKFPAKYEEKLKKVDNTYLTKTNIGFSLTEKGFEISNTILCDILDLDY